MIANGQYFPNKVLNESRQSAHVHFGAPVDQYQPANETSDNQQKDLQTAPLLHNDVTWPNLTQIKNQNDTYSSNELGSLANARPLPPPSHSEQVSSMYPATSTSGFVTKRELMKVTIDLGEGAHETILVREGESAEMVSRAFAAKFDLTEDTEFLLREQIEYNLAQLPNQTRSDISSVVSKSQITQKIASAASVPTLSKVKMNKFSAPISEEGHSEDDGEIAIEENEQKSTISNINSMDPV